MTTYTVPYTNRTKCKRCGAEILWGKNIKGEWIALNPSPITPHAETCFPFWRERPKREPRVKLTPLSQQFNHYQIRKMWAAFMDGVK
ncbi:MAG: hypothetical protein R6U20_12255, partial [Longimonas sp.]